MTEKRAIGRLNLIPIDKILPNPENPRIFFRQVEMESLMVSISQYGIQVPLTVYSDDGRYFLIDGERRWRCAKKLNLKQIPAMVQDKPSTLENLLLMYNIHALREQWDYFTIASKLERIIDLYQKETKEKPSEAMLSEITGLTRGKIRRCQLLIDLPDRYKIMLLEELKLPKSRQKISEDLLIEMERSLKTVVKRMPEYEKQLDDIRDTLIDKFRKNIIDAVTDFRQLSKIATSVDTLGVAKKKAEESLDDIFNPRNKTGIKNVYRDTVEFEYVGKKALQQIEFLNGYFDDIIEYSRIKDLDDEFLKELKKLYQRLRKLLAS
jgi:ParB family chromosome partitioning protein